MQRIRWKEGQVNQVTVGSTAHIKKKCAELVTRRQPLNNILGQGLAIYGQWVASSLWSHWIQPTELGLCPHWATSHLLCSWKTSQQGAFLSFTAAGQCGEAMARRSSNGSGDQALALVHFRPQADYGVPALEKVDNCCPSPLAWLNSYDY